MLTMSLREALDTPDSDEEMQYVYLYREGTVVFYAGRSTRPFERLQEHIGNTALHSYPDAIGTFILNNQPVSLAWEVQIGSIQELAPDRYARIVEKGSNPSSFKLLASDIEKLLIEKCKPQLNSMGLHGGTPLPDRYATIANEGVKISEE